MDGVVWSSEYYPRIIFSITTRASIIYYLFQRGYDLKKPPSYSLYHGAIDYSA